MYLIISLHSDIEFSVVRLAQQIANHNKLSNESVVAYSNLDWAQDSELYKSVTSYFILIACEVTS